MRGFMGFTRRNLMLYFKDVQSVIFSLLTSIIVFVLYLLFLKGTFLDAIEGAMQGLETLVSDTDIDMLVSGILLTGIIGSALSVAAAYGITLLGAVSATAFFMIVVLFFQSSSASGAFFGILSAAAGFVIGAYIPISQFSEGVQTFCNLFPASGITVLFRNAILNGLLEEINLSLGDIDQGMFVESMEECFTFRASLFGNSLSQAQSVWYVVGCTAVCLFVMILIYSRTYKRR